VSGVLSCALPMSGFKDNFAKKPVQKKNRETYLLFNGLGTVLKGL